jgi:hypothetical protein
MRMGWSRSVLTSPVLLLQTSWSSWRACLPDTLDLREPRGK